MPEPRLVLKGMMPEIEVPTDRESWGPEDYAKYCGAIEALQRSMEQVAGGRSEGTDLIWMFRKAAWNDLACECCQRFGLFPARFDYEVILGNCEGER